MGYNQVKNVLKLLKKKELFKTAFTVAKLTLILPMFSSSRDCF